MAKRATAQDARRARWMASYETELLKLAPHLAGRIDWNSAAFHYSQETDARDAAARHFASLLSE